MWGSHANFEKVFISSNPIPTQLFCGVRTGWPHSFVRDDMKQKFLNATELAKRERPKDPSRYPSKLESKGMKSGSAVAYTARWDEPVDMSDGTRKASVVFSYASYGDDTLSSAWRYFISLYDRTYRPVGSPEGRGVLKGKFHGDKNREFNVYVNPALRSYVRINVSN